MQIASLRKTICNVVYTGHHWLLVFMIIFRISERLNSNLLASSFKDWESSVRDCKMMTFKKNIETVCNILR